MTDISVNVKKNNNFYNKLVVNPFVGGNFMNDDFVEQQLREMSKTMKSIREIYGISQSQLAKLMGVSRSVVADIEQEKRFPELPSIFKLCNTLKISPTELSSFTFKNWEMYINTDERAELHKDMYKSAQKTVYENAMEWRMKESEKRNSRRHLTNRVVAYLQVFLNLILW